ncbi:hypothetical protein F0160_13760 [Paraburkholderia sp. JPY303]|uniref:hypothetical protein n=1 Tax=Paraburkholderia atlantica TaxID=2654982 RepID=UPI001590A4E7|nr:hypothetical protein [Paraburkholderia atlantica]NUY31561.1 hypothetical protein [Paraburkholderia atlantica]
MLFFTFVSSWVIAFLGPCCAAREVTFYSKSLDSAGKLKGRWSPDCNNLEGIKMDGDLQAEFTINSNQIVINSVLKENIKEDGIINVYFESPLDLGRGGMGLDWDNFSRIR